MEVHFYNTDPSTNLHTILTSVGGNIISSSAKKKLIIVIIIMMLIN